MDPMTQSAQISSSQGFADGQNSAAKESKLSDSFLSSSPVSLIQSPQDKRVVLGSDKPCDGVATSLRFPSQPGSFSPGSHASDAGQPDGQPDSPIKTSPVSERIKALEALAAKKKGPDFRSDGGYSQFRERHFEKSPTENPKSPTENQRFATENPKSPTEKKFFTESSKFSTEFPKSPVETPKSPIETPKSPVETPKSPSEAPKPPPEKSTPPVKKSGGSADQESPDSPFEILGDMRQVNEFEETEEWMKAHLPPVPDFTDGLPKDPDAVASKGKESGIVVPDAPAAFAAVPDDFMDSPGDAPKLKDDLGDVQKQSSLEEEFDLSFLPTAYMWDHQDKSGVQPQSNPDQSPAPPEGFGSTSPFVSSERNVSEEKTSAWTRDMEPPEASEADSSGESDDTVIGEGSGTPASAPAPSTAHPTPTSAPPDEEKERPPPKSERKLMQVPTINVIETDEPNYSEEEEEEEEEEPEAEENESARKGPATEVPKPTEPDENKTEPAKTRPLETEFMEGYSPPSSPVDSDSEYSPKHKILKSIPETKDEKPQVASGDQTNSSNPKGSAPDKPHTFSHKIEDASALANEDADFPDDDEWSEEAREILVSPYQPSNKQADKSSGPVPLSKTSFMQDDIYDRQSFDYDYEASSTFDDVANKGLNNAKERFLSENAQIHMETLNAKQTETEDGQSLDSNNDEDMSGGLCQREYPQDPYSCFPLKPPTDNTLVNDDTRGDPKTAPRAPAKAPVPEDNGESEPTDSFVDFMRECLKSKQDEEPGSTRHSEVPPPGAAPPQPSPSAVTNIEQERLTITALKQLGGSHDEEDEAAAKPPPPPKGSDRDRAEPSTTLAPQSSNTSAASPQSDPVPDSAYSKEVEAIDEWVAEAYHLAEHVLTAILTHLSVKDLIHWRDPKKSGLVFGLSLLLLLSLAAFSVISVASYLLLALLCVTITFRIYKSVVQAVQKSNDGHPFKSLIEKDVSIPPETFRKNVDASLTYINRALKQMSRLFLVEDLVDSLKLAVVMWLLTYVGAVFNGITILILADILLFAVPPIYEKNKTQIDQYIDLARTQVNTTIAKLQEKLPGAAKRSKTE